MLTTYTAKFSNVEKHFLSNCFSTNYLKFKLNQKFLLHLFICKVININLQLQNIVTESNVMESFPF